MFFKKAKVLIVAAVAVFLFAGVAQAVETYIDLYESVTSWDTNGGRNRGDQNKLVDGDYLTETYIMSVSHQRPYCA